MVNNWGFFFIQAGIPMLKLFDNVKDVFQYRMQNPVASNEKQFGRHVGRAYDRLLKFMDGANTLLAQMGSNEKPWQNESEFNVFVARRILQLLSGGFCLINDDHKAALMDSRARYRRETANVLLPRE